MDNSVSAHTAPGLITGKNIFSGDRALSVPGPEKDRAQTAFHLTGL